MTEKIKVQPFTIAIEIPVTEKAYMYVAARNEEEATEAAMSMMADFPEYAGAVVVKVEPYKKPTHNEASISLN